MEQMSIFDFLPQDDITCRILKEEDKYLIGKVIPFTALKDMIGKKVIVQDLHRYRIVLITQYWEKSKKIYKRVRPLPDNDIGYGEYVNDYIHDVCGIKECMDCYELFKEFDSVSYSESEKKKSDCFMSEYYCTGGRWNMVGSLNETFYELNA